MVIMPAKSVKKVVEKKDGIIAFATGKRKKAVANVIIKEGKGGVKINNIPLEHYPNPFVRMKIREPIVLAGEKAESLSMSISVKGGGITGQADASRQAIAKALSDVIGEDLRKKYLLYDRNLLVYDVRRTEPHKPPRSSQGPRRYKQRSKR